MLLQVDIAELHAALVYALNPNCKLTAAEFQDHEITFVHGSEPDQSFATGNVYSPNGQLLNRLLEGWCVGRNRHLERRVRFGRVSRRMLGNGWEPFEFTANRESERVGGMPVGQQLAVLQ